MYAIASIFLDDNCYLKLARFLTAVDISRQVSATEGAGRPSQYRYCIFLRWFCVKQAQISALHHQECLSGDGFLVVLWVPGSWLTEDQRNQVWANYSYIYMPSCSRAWGNRVQQYRANSGSPAPGAAGVQLPAGSTHMNLIWEPQLYWKY